MNTIVLIARQLESGMSQRQIASLFKVGRRRVSTIKDVIVKQGISAQQIEGMSENDLDQIFPYHGSRPDKIPYRLTQFKHYLHEHLKKNKRFADIIDHRPGDAVQVDWAGTTIKLIDPSTGEVRIAYLFVGVLPFSQYCYAEAFMDMKQENWIMAHVHMFNYFGGVPRFIVCDNLRTGVQSHLKHDDPLLNQYYLELSDYYHCPIIAAAVRAPRQKNVAEKSVDVMTTHIIAAMRDLQFFNIEDYNQELLKKLSIINSDRFKKKDSSRKELFEFERTFMSALPAVPYEFATWREGKVQLNSCVALQKMFYSVPYKYIGEKVDLRITGSKVEIFHNRCKIAEHPHLHGRLGQYSMVKEHFPEYSNAYSEWNKDRFVRWASKIGPSTAELITSLFDHYPIEQQGYSGAKSILLLSNRYSAQSLEAACRIVNSNHGKPRYKNVRAVILSGQEAARHEAVIKASQGSADTAFSTDESKDNVRGAGYYDRKL
jgi:hypothetical protein